MEQNFSIRPNISILKGNYEAESTSKCLSGLMSFHWAQDCQHSALRHAPADSHIHIDFSEALRSRNMTYILSHWPLLQLCAGSTL